MNFALRQAYLFIYFICLFIFVWEGGTYLLNEVVLGMEQDNRLTWWQ